MPVNIKVDIHGKIGGFRVEDPEERATILAIFRGQLRAHESTVAKRKREAEALSAMRLAAGSTVFYEMLERSIEFGNHMSRTAMECEKAGTSILHYIIVDSGAEFSVHVVSEQRMDHHNESVPAFRIRVLGCEGYVFEHSDHLFFWLRT